MKLIALLFIAIPLNLFAQWKMDKASLDIIDGTTCRNRALQSIPNDSTGLNTICPNPAVVGKSTFFACENGCYQIKKKQLSVGKEPIVLYQFYLESGFWIASYEVNIKHHEKCFQKTYWKPKKQAIILPEGGPIELNMWEAMLKSMKK
jgi:hypothetical protein